MISITFQGVQIPRLQQSSLRRLGEDALRPDPRAYGLEQNKVRRLVLEALGVEMSDVGYIFVHFEDRGLRTNVTSLGEDGIVGEYESVICGWLRKSGTHVVAEYERGIRSQKIEISKVLLEYMMDFHKNLDKPGKAYFACFCGDETFEEGVYVPTLEKKTSTA